VRQELKVRKIRSAWWGPVTDDRIIISSFNLDSLVYAHRFCRTVSAGAEPGAGTFRARCAARVDGQPFLYGLCVDISTLDSDMMKVVRDRGKRIAVYTCDTDGEIARALTLGVDCDDQ